MTEVKIKAHRLQCQPVGCKERLNTFRYSQTANSFGQSSIMLLGNQSHRHFAVINIFVNIHS